ncbi:hypothetical protein RHMOL_Rhmol01G0062500 [Rhododendron molle]|uniref:Uncharacterized protein n=1 Tax=Rhododendron molle TaxID=49168 RepID=A0ACC0PYF6_RHOML|nr:hypothetical protein RHMOL_Rhmol01G0062500 [Rhododendron molle]
MRKKLYTNHIFRWDWFSICTSVTAYLDCQISGEQKRNRLRTNSLARLDDQRGLASALGVAHKFYSANLVSNPLHTLHLIWVIETPIVVLIYSMFRSNPKQCSEYLVKTVVLMTGYWFREHR